MQPCRIPSLPPPPPPANKTCPDNFSQAPRFGNGRTITDLAKCIFTEIGLRLGDGGGGGGSGDHNDDQKASVQDVRRSTAAIFKQMTTAAGPNTTNTAAADPKAAFFAGSQGRKTTTTTTTKTTASQDKETGAKSTAEEGDADHEASASDRDSFLSAEELNVLREACEIAGVPADSPDSALEASEALRRAFLLPRAEGGIGFSSAQRQAFMRKVLADRAALSGAGQETADKAARLASDEADAGAALSEVEATLAKAAEDEDDELLATLMRVKRAKKRALEKAKEERERELALEVASQAALRRLGVCPAGYRWNRIGGGWRCSGGSHFVSGTEVAAEMARGGSS